ncbi:hypothetical protein UlMin_005846 [Ulmus minor]
MKDDDVKLLLDSQNEKLCKNPLNVTLVRKGDEESDGDGGDFCSHDGGGGIHDTFFDEDFLETNEIEVGTSIMKLPVIRNVETIGVELDSGSAVSTEEFSDDGERNFSPDLKLFVGNLPFSVDSAKLVDIFGRVGNVEMVEEIDGRALRVNYGPPPTREDGSFPRGGRGGGGGGFDSGNRVYVGNLPWNDLNGRPIRVTQAEYKPRRLF